MAIVRRWVPVLGPDLFPHLPADARAAIEDYEERLFAGKVPDSHPDTPHDGFLGEHLANRLPMRDITEG